MIKVCILAGGSSYEREVSLSSAEEIYSNLDRNKYTPEILEIPKEASTIWIKKLLESPPDIVLSALHGGLGEDGSVQGLMECMGIKYVGSKVLSSALCLDKHISKIIMRANHIPVLDDVLIKNSNDLNILKDLINDMGYPLVVKPNIGGSSVGISIVKSFSELEKAVNEVFLLNDYALIEKFVSGTEVTCGIIENEKGLQVLPVLDIKTARNFYDYNAKYKDDDTSISFSSLPKFLQAMIHEISKKVFILLNCRGYGRVDMIVHEEQIIVLEMNTLPGLTSHSLIPKAASMEMGGFSKFLDGLIEFEMKK